MRILYWNTNELAIKITYSQNVLFKDATMIFVTWKINDCVQK